MTNPNQEQAPDKLSLGEALRTMAERTSFRTESERDAVLATFDEHIEADRAQRERDQAEADERERAEQAEANERADEIPTPATVPAARGSKAK